MDKLANVVSSWTRRVESGQQPNSDDLLDHLATVHESNAGFTESLAWNCRDTHGKNSYEILADIIDHRYHKNVLDLACGSGVLLDLCNQRFGNKLSFLGIDSSDAELQLARKRLALTKTKLTRCMAQNLDFIDDASVDIILCHWALTLMDPVVPVLKTVKRVLKPHGIFAAIIDGDSSNSSSYSEINDIIYGHTQRRYPDYGAIELGDPRIRTTKKLQELAIKIFGESEVNITPGILGFAAPPDLLARETAGFFYASFVLSTVEHQEMLNELENYFSINMEDGEGYFSMPINLLVIQKGQ
ncbi:MAG: class I SAM-dependent methyltransferase [Rhodospirillaceae bacterium]|nr:class I SAM-dependent methyltransferase [Rhodospirillaceae bacterium]